ncbi:MAG: hydrogenase maturation protease [Magnetococcales bacterium]|nr:hydrogenase maturation protease [Magnetococcales bacterium]
MSYVLTVIGVGSHGGCDDAVGLHLVTLLAESQSAGCGSGVDCVLWESADALTLVHDLLELANPVLLVDCADMGLAGGEWRAFVPGEGQLRLARDAVSTHGLGIAEALELARGLGFSHALRVFGVQPFDLTPRIGLTAEMGACLPVLFGALAEEVKRLLPDPSICVPVDKPFDRPVLGLGIETKSALALGRGDTIHLYGSFGDLGEPMRRVQMERAVDALLNGEDPPGVIVVDRHPDMFPGVLGRRLARERGLQLLEVQHHQAHAAACMAEHGLEHALALTFDGMGYGGDGTLWGAELLEVGRSGWLRLATFAPVPLPGGDAAVRHPLRQLFSRLLDARVEINAAWQERLGITPLESMVWSRQCRTGLQAPLTHAAGRLFDAFAAWLDLAPACIAFEGEPAIRLQAVAESWQGEPLPAPLPFVGRMADGIWIIDWSGLFAMLPPEPPCVSDRPAWAYAFHLAVAAAMVEMAVSGADRCGVRDVVLSGGVFFNGLLRTLLVERLEQAGLRVWVHRRIPTGDGGIAVGQVWLAGKVE